MVKENKIYWKTASKDNAKNLVNALSERGLNIELKERKNKNCKTLKQYNEGIMYGEGKAIKQQKKFIDNLELNMYRFIVIEY